jgi:hypothetical protein
MKDFNERDLFAGLAMVGMLANPIMEDASNDDIAFGSYQIADAMLKEKEKRDEF